MTDAIGAILGNAVGVSISPVAIISLILVLFSHKPRANSLAFLAGWVLGMLALMGAIAALDPSSRSAGGQVGGDGLVQITIGLAFLFLAWKQWQARPRPGVEASLPGWMSAIEHASPMWCLGLGALLSSLNPKNLGLTIGAGTIVGAAGLDAGETAIVMAVFVALASLTILIPVVGFLVAQERVRPILQSWRVWLNDNNAVVMTVLFLILGTQALGAGLPSVG